MEEEQPWEVQVEAGTLWRFLPAWHALPVGHCTGGGPEPQLKAGLQLLQGWKAGLLQVRFFPCLRVERVPKDFSL